MLIPIEDIKKAKESLGEKSAHIIAKGLKIERWDDIHLKGCCPFHKEDTASFIWNKKESCFKCFGCGRTYGILDYYIDKGMSFREASEELFREASMKLDLQDIESDIKYKRQYKYPKKETNTDRIKVEQYMSLRKISKETLDYAGIRQDKHGNIVFEYYDENNRLLLSKYRPSKKVDKTKGDIKNWCQKDADTTPILFNMNRIDPTKPLVICEGETDSLSVIESGFKNVVSVPFGANNYSWIEENWEWLEQFEKIVIWSDYDDAGQNMRTEVIPRLGEWRCYEINWQLADGIKIGNRQIKDINEVLYVLGKEKVLEMIDKAKEVPIADVVDLADVKDFDINKAEKIQSGIKGLDKYISGFVLGTVDIVTGINGSGKSTFVNQVCVCEPVEQGYKTFIFSGELTKPQLKSWIEFPMSGRKHIKEIDKGQFQPKGYVVPNEIKRRMESWYRGKIFVYDNEFDYRAKSIIKKMEELARKHGVKNFVIDNLMMIDLECSEYEKNTKQKEFVLELVKFANRFKAVIHLVAHPRKIEAIRRLNKMEVCGSGDITNLAHYVVAIHRVSDKEKEGITNTKGDFITPPIPYDCLIDLFKNRPLGFQDKTIGVHYDMGSKRFFGDSDDADKKYSWDTTDSTGQFTTNINDDEIDLPYQ